MENNNNNNQPKNITQSLIDKANQSNIPLVKTNISEAEQRGMAASRAFRRSEQLTRQLEFKELKAKEQEDIVKNIADLSYGNQTIPSLYESKQLKPQDLKFMQGPGAINRPDVTVSLSEVIQDKNKLSASLLTANSLKARLDAGDMTGLDELKQYYQNIYNKVDSKDKQLITKKYQQVEQYYSEYNKDLLAKKNLDEYFKTSNPEQRKNYLNQINKAIQAGNKPNIAYDLKGIQSSSRDIESRLLDISSYDFGSPVYDPEKLNFYKNFKLEDASSAVKTEYDDFYGDINYKYNVSVYKALNAKQSELSNQISEIDKQLKNKPNNAQLLQQKGQLESDINFAKQAQSKIEPLLNKKDYLKNYYPLAYNKQVREEKAQFKYNERLGWSGFAKDPIGKTYQTIYRGIEAVGSGIAGTQEGLGFLMNAPEFAMSSGLKKKALAPPTYIRAIDFNKDSVLDANEVIKDKDGNSIVVSDISWTDEKGKTHWNLATGVEQFFPIAYDVGTTILLTRGAGAIARGAGASWSNISKGLNLSKAANQTLLTEIAPRLSTFGGTLATTFPRMYAEEKNNFKDEGDAFNVALMRSSVEALTETIVPDTEFFKDRPSFGMFDSVIKKLGKFDPTQLAEMSLKRDILLGLAPKNSLSSFKAGLLTAPSLIRKTLSGAAQETLEEELSLLGNYFIDNYAASNNLEIPQANELTLDNFLDTAVSGFIPSLLLSGITNLGNAKLTRLNQARWDIANNPDLYINRVNAQLENGKITKEDAYKKVAAIKQLKMRLDSVENISDIRDLTTLMEDKELQYETFTSKLLSEDLLNIDPTQLTEEQKAEYDKALEDSAKVQLKAKDKSYQYQNLTEKDKIAIIDKVFQNSKKNILDKKTPLASLMQSLEIVDKQLNVTRDNKESEDQSVITEGLNSRYFELKQSITQELMDRLDAFKNRLTNNPSDVTLSELFLASRLFIPALKQKQQQLDQIPFLNFGPQQNELLDLVQEEVLSREILSEEEFYNEVSKDLGNNDVKPYVTELLAFSELSEQELESGELDEDGHEHLPDSLKLLLGIELLKHQSEKQENPSEKTSLEKRRESYLKNYYKRTVENLSPEDILTKVRDMNAKVLNYEKAKSTLVEKEGEIITEAEEKNISDPNNGKDTSSFKPQETPKKDDSQPEPKLVSQRSLNPEIFEEYQKARLDVINLLNDELERGKIEGTIETPEDEKLVIAKFSRKVIPAFLNQTYEEFNDILDIESALLGFYDRYLKESNALVKFFDSVNANNTDYSLLSIFPDYIVDSLKAKLDTFLKEEINIDDNKDKNEDETDEEVNNENENKNYEDKENNRKNDPAIVPTPLSVDGTFELNIITADNNNVDVIDEYTLRASNIIFQVNDIFKNGGTLDMQVSIQNTANTFKRVLGPNRYQRLETLSNKQSLTQQEKDELKNLFTLNQQLILDERILTYFQKNPKTILDKRGIFTLAVDSNNNIIYFDKLGNRVSEDVGVPFIATIKNNDAIKQALESVDNLIAPVTGVTSGKELTDDVKNSTTNPEDIYIHTEEAPVQIYQKIGGIYTLRQGFAYVKNENSIYPYKEIFNPKYEAEEIIKLIELFNSGDLGKLSGVSDAFPTEANDFLKFLVSQLNAIPVTKTFSLIHLKSAKLYLAKAQRSNKIIFKTENEEGKVVSIKKDVALELLKKSEPFKNVSFDKLKSNAKFEALVFVKGLPTIKTFNNYSEYFFSSEFGAKVKKVVNKTITFSKPGIQAPNQDTNDLQGVSDNNPVESTTNVTDTSIESQIETLKQPTTPKAPEQTTKGRLRKKNQSITSRLNSQIDSDTDDIKLNRSKKLANKITKEENKKAKEFVDNHPIFKNTTFIFDQTIDHPEAYAVWSKAAIKLFKGANYAEAYHEAWHEFSQLYLTPSQKLSLYKEARNIYGDLPFVELEEKLAESFRQYALSDGKVIPNEIKKYKESKNIFEKIWEFITNFFSSKKSVDHYFTQLYKGNISQYKRDVNNAYFKNLYSSKLSLYDRDDNLVVQSFKQRAQIIEEFDALFVQVANQMFQKQGGTVVNVLGNRKAELAVYKKINSFLYNEWKSLYEDYENTNEEDPDFNELENLLLYYYEKINNIETLISFHNQNSTLFKNKIKENNISEILDENNKDEGIGDFELSVNEVSQKDLASDLIINIIRTLPKYKNGEPVLHPMMGYELIGDFNENWNILQRTLSGLSSYQDMYNKIKEISSTYPQFKTLLSYMPDPKSDITRLTDISFKNQFFNIFSMPYINGVTVKIETNEKNETNDNDEETQKVGKSKSRTFKVLRATSLDAVSLRSYFDSEFNFAPNNFNKLNSSGIYEFNFDKFFSTYPESLPEPGSSVSEEEIQNYISNAYEILKALGIRYTDFGESALYGAKPKEIRTNLNRILKKLKGLSKVDTPLYTPLGSISRDHVEDKKLIKSENAAIAYFLNFEVDSNPEYANDMRYNAVEKQVWSVNQHTYMTKVLNVLNDADKYPTLDDVVKKLPHLDQKRNTNPRGSFILSYMFGVNGKRLYEDGKPRTINLVNLFGLVEDNQGEKLIDTTTKDKHLSDVVGLLKGGVEEINRLSGKNTTRGLDLPLQARKDLGLITSETERDPYQFVDSSNNASIDPRLFTNHIIKLIKAEVDTYNNPSPNFKFKDNDSNIPQLAYFSQIFTEPLRKQIVEDFKNFEEGKSINDFVNSLPYINSIRSQFNTYLNKNAEASIKFLNEPSLTKEDLVKYHFASFILRIEQHKILFNHPYYYKNPKDIEKRISAWNAFGSYPVVDEQNIQSLYSLSNKPYSQEDAYLSYAEKQGITVNHRQKNPSKISYLVFKDNPVVSQTALNSKHYDKVRSAYTEDKGSAAQDAAAVATMDFYRRSYLLSTGITQEMEQEFERQNKIWYHLLQSKLSVIEFEKQYHLDKLEELMDTKPYYNFNIKKFQYAGNNVTSVGTSDPIFHKYSIKAILPSEAVFSERAFNVLEKLMSSGADYGVFKSGTKITETVKEVNLFNEDGSIDKSAQNTGEIDIEYLKEQVIVENKETFLTIFSTQLRKLLFKDLSNEKELEAYNLYKKYVDELINYDKDLFLEKIENKEQLVEFIVNELNNKNASEATKDLIQIKEDGKLQYVLDSLVDRTIMESAFVSSIKNKIVRQKVNGVQRVQFPVSLISDEKLAYYDIKDGKITKAETIIPFNKSYHNLLKLTYNGKQFGLYDESGNILNKFSALKKLNNALRDPEFVKQNERALTISGIRIPGQGYNSMENFIIKQFLPEESGEIILVPDEMVIKSGSDYDIDKLFMYEPYIDNFGKVETNKYTLKEIKELKKTLKDDIEKTTNELKYALYQRRNLLDNLKTFLDKYGIDSVKDVYEEYTRLKEQKIDRDNELEYTGEIDPMEALKRKFEQGESLESILNKKPKSEELTDLDKQLNNLSRILADYSSFGVGEDNLTTQIKKVNSLINQLRNKNENSKNELKSIRSRMSNNILFALSDRLTNVEIFEDLITPNSINEISSLAKDVIPNSNTVATYTNIVNPMYQLYVFSLNSYKRSLGTDAKNNVLHSMLQKANVYIESEIGSNKYLLSANKTEDNKVTFAGRLDTNGRPISLIQGQMISAHVDIEKNDDIARLNFNNIVTPVANYMTMAGTPFNEIVNLINKKVNGTSLIIEFSKGKSLNEVLEEKLDSTQSNSVKNIIESCYGEYGISKAKVLKKFTSMVNNVTRDTLMNKLLNEETDDADLLRFFYFLEMKDQSEKMFILSANTDFDTFSPQNFESFRKGGAELKKLLDSNFFNKEGVEKMMTDTIVSSFQIQSEVFDKLVSLFPISANEQITRRIVTTHSAIKPKIYAPEYERFSRIYKNDLLYYLYANETNMVAEYREHIDKRNTNNIKALYEEIKFELNSRGITSDNKIFDLARFNTSEKTSYIRTGLRQTKLDYDVNFYREEFEKGFNYSHPELNPEIEKDAELIGKIQEWFRIFAVSGIIGTTLNKTFDSYLPLIPEEVYTQYMSSILEEFSQKSKEDVTALLNRFEVRFRFNHPELFGKRIPKDNPSTLYYREYMESVPLPEKYIPADSPQESISNEEEDGEDIPTTEIQPTTQKEYTSSNILDKNILDKNLLNTLYKSGLTDNDYDIELINDVQTIVINSKMPEKIKKGYSIFYSRSIDGILQKRSGKKIVVPNFEDIDLMLDQETKEVFELTTGLWINTNSKTQSKIIEELQEIFKNYDVRSTIKNTKKITANQPNAVISKLKENVESKQPTQKSNNILSRLNESIQPETPLTLEQVVNNAKADFLSEFETNNEDVKGKC